MVWWCGGLWFGGVEDYSLVVWGTIVWWCRNYGLVVWGTIVWWCGGLWFGGVGDYGLVVWGTMIWWCGGLYDVAISEL